MSNAVSLIAISIITPGRVMFEGKVIEVQVPAKDGYMGFLPDHAPLVSPLGTGILTCKTAESVDIYFEISGGYFEIHSNKMIVLADSAESSSGPALYGRNMPGMVYAEFHAALPQANTYSAPLQERHNKTMIGEK